MEQGRRQEGRVYHSRVDGSGRIVLPVEIRSAFGLAPGSRVLVVQDADGVHIETPERALKELQAYYKKLVPPGVSLVDELIAERRAEAARE